MMKQLHNQKLKHQKFKKETPVSVVICTPLMARVHKHVPQAGEMMYVDLSSSMDRYNLSVFLLSTSHSGGGLLLGAMIVSDESTQPFAVADYSTTENF